MYQKILKLIFKDKSEEIRGLDKQNTTLTNSYELGGNRVSTFFKKIRRLSKKCVESKIFETFIIGTILISSIVLVRKKNIVWLNDKLFSKIWQTFRKKALEDKNVYDVIETNAFVKHFFDISDNIFTAIFLTELLLK
jgi:hypothetical protein